MRGVAFVHGGPKDLRSLLVSMGQHPPVGAGQTGPLDMRLHGRASLLGEASGTLDRQAPFSRHLHDQRRPRYILWRVDEGNALVGYLCIEIGPLKTVLLVGERDVLEENVCRVASSGVYAAETGDTLDRHGEVGSLRHEVNNLRVVAEVGTASGDINMQRHGLRPLEY